MVRSFGVLACTVARILSRMSTFIDIGASVDNVGVSLVAIGAAAVVARPIFGVNALTVIADAGVLRGGGLVRVVARQYGAGDGVVFADGPV